MSRHLFENNAGQLLGPFRAEGEQVVREADLGALRSSIGGIPPFEPSLLEPIVALADELCMSWLAGSVLEALQQGR